MSTVGGASSTGFSPGLLVVVSQQYPDGFPARARNQFTLDRFFSHQSHRPTRPPFRWRAADHGEHILPLRLVQSRLGAGTRTVIERKVQATTAVAVSDLADGLRSQGNRLRHQGRGASLGELTERQGAHDNANVLHTRSQDLLDANQISRLDSDGYRAPRHAQS